jgi:hypothetical protein
MDYELKGYAPDLDPTLPGVVTNCSAWIPSAKGMRAAPSAKDTTITALAAECRSAAVLIQLDETVRFLAGTITNVYEEGSGTWTSRYTNAAGETLSATDRWNFGIFGNIELAVAPTVGMIGSDSGALTTVSNSGTNAPKAAVLETVGDFVMLFNYTPDGGGLIADGWICSALGDYTDFNTSIATQSTSGRLYSTPGKIIGAKRFGEGVAVYKKTSIYIGVYEGPPVIWRWIEVPGNIGAVSNEVIIDVGTSEDPKHIFMGKEDFYVFDGTKPIPLFAPCKEKVFGEINWNKTEQCMSLHDRQNSLIYFYYPVADQNFPDKCVVYNYRTNMWGVDDRTVQAVVEYIATGVTYTGLGSFYTTYDDLPNVSYDTAFPSGNQTLPAVFNTLNKVVTLTGEPTSSSFTSNEFGDDTMFSLVSRVKPRYLTAPTSASLANFYKNNIGDSFTTDMTVGETNERFDYHRESRWHQFRLDFTGDVELAYCRIDMNLAGDE